MLHFVLCTYYKIFLAALAVPASMSIASSSNAQSPKLRRRNLQDSAFKIFWLSETVRFEVPLFLELQYLNKTVIDQIENRGNTSDPQPQPVVDLCKCLTAQTAGTIVYRAAAEINATLTVPQNSKCDLLGTVTVDDPEALDIFGPGFYALQIHTTLSVSTTSKEFISLEQVSDLVSSGFQITTGGQRLFFLNCLNQFPSFKNVLAVELRRGLLAPTAAPTRQPVVASTPFPTGRPTALPTARPSIPPTRLPTQLPTRVPTNRPSSSPPTTKASLRPTLAPTRSPTPEPSPSPSLSPSIPPTTLPSAMPSAGPNKISLTPTAFGWNTAPIVLIPTENPTPTSQESPPTDMSGQVKQEAIPDHLLVAAISAAVVMFVVVASIICCLCWRTRKPKHSKPAFALTTKDGQLGPENLKNTIPGFVELDQQSLADTSLGEQTAGGFRRPRSANKAKPIPKPIRQTQSFDENSLYTTPFSIQQDDISPYHQPAKGRLISSSQVLHHNSDYDKKILYPISDSTTTSSDGQSSNDAPSSSEDPRTNYMASTTSAESSRVMVPSTGNSIGGSTKAASGVVLVNNITRAQMVSQAIDEGSSAYDIDTWSYDYEEFDRDPDEYELQARSRSPSHSSRSTTKAKNLSSVLSTRNGNSAHDSRIIGVIDNAARQHLPDPPEQILQNRWSQWSSMVQSGSFKGPEGKENNRGSSPLSKLLDSVSQVVSLSPIRSQGRIIPAVTPEETESDIDQPTESSWSKEDESTLIGLQFKDEASESSVSTGISDSPWLFDKVEESLGPRSLTADMESLSGRSNLSTKSPSHRSRAGGSTAARSVGSKISYHSSIAQQSEASFAPRTLEHDLKRLEKQLEALDNDVTSTSSAGVSSITAASLARASAISLRGAPKMNGKKKLVVMVPPGKLGVILANRHDGKGTVVSEIRNSSPLHQMLSPGDKLIGVDDVDVTCMVVSQITSLMASRADRERRLTVITSVAQQYKV